MFQVKLILIGLNCSRVYWNLLNHFFLIRLNFSVQSHEYFYYFHCFSCIHNNCKLNNLFIWSTNIKKRNFFSKDLFGATIKYGNVSNFKNEELFLILFLSFGIRWIFMVDHWRMHLVFIWIVITVCDRHTW